VLLKRGHKLGDEVVWFPELEEAGLAGVEIAEGRLWVEVSARTHPVLLVLDIDELAELLAACERALEAAGLEGGSGSEEPPQMPEQEVPEV
jgi:hypothetical protein